MILIPYMPEELQAIPSITHEGMSDAQRYEVRLAFIEWRKGILKHRLERESAISGPDSGQEARRELERCRRSILYWAVTWVWIYEPRPEAIPDDFPLLEDELEGFLRFTPFEFQANLLQTMVDALSYKKPKGNIVCSKTRDFGATWCACIFVLWGFLFRRPFTAGLVSRMEDLVDKKNDPDSMFWKVLAVFDRIPDFMRPQGFEYKEHRHHMSLVNPEIPGNIIKGEATTERSGRGGRNTVRINDEAAQFPGFGEVYNAQVATTNHIYCFSSESVRYGDDFYQLGNEQDPGRSPTKLPLDWWQHPFRTRAWLAEQRASYRSEESFQQEVLRNPYAGFGAWVYPSVRDVSPGQFPYVPGMPLYLSIDPGFDDETAIVAYAYDSVMQRYRMVEAFESQHKPPEFYASLMTGIPDPEFAHEHVAKGAFDAQSFIHLVGSAPMPSLFGDPHGNQKKTGDDGFYDRLEARMVNLCEHGKTTSGKKRSMIGWSIFKNWSNDAREYQGRRMSLMNVLKRIDFDDVPSVRQALKALKEYRFEEDNGRGRQNEQPKPRHNWASHLTTASEYFSVNIDDWEGSTKMDLRSYDGSTKKVFGVKNGRSDPIPA